MPFWMIYFCSNLAYFVLFHLVKYRRKVVLKNVQNSFPELSDIEHKRIVRKFYRHLANLLAESVKNLSISEKALRKRMIVRNPEVMDDLYQQKREVLLVSSHFNNWELLITAQNLIFKHKAVGIGMPLSNKFWDKKINDRRERFGMKVVNSNNYKEILDDLKNEPTATLILGDQSPGKDENCYWTTFLHQPTAFFFGAEIIANQRDAAVVYAVIHQVKRGYFEIELKCIAQQPKTLEYGAITKRYVELLEADIQTAKHLWLWSHKRWKKDVPKNLTEIQENHKSRFNKKFR